MLGQDSMGYLARWTLGENLKAHCKQRNLYLQRDKIRQGIGVDIWTNPPFTERMTAFQTACAQMDQMELPGIEPGKKQTRHLGVS